MKRDIVERMRWWVANRNFSPVLDETLAEAADEIERLRVRLKLAAEDAAAIRARASEGK
jgi:hypothetical protein